jgi:hypothetical protein
MNALALIQRQMKKAARLHTAQLAMIGNYKFPVA